MAGLSAADHLVSSGIKNIALLEGSNRLGGRIHTRRFGSGHVEMGAQWVHGAKLSNAMFLFGNVHKLIDMPPKCEDWSVQTVFKGDGLRVDDDIVKRVEQIFEKIRNGKIENGKLVFNDFNKGLTHFN